MIRRIVHQRVLPGEPTDGSGRTCIHLLVRDPHGPSVEPNLLYPMVGDDGQLVKGKLEARPGRARLACDPGRRVTPITHNGITTVTHRTEEPEAVTCLKCKVSPEYLAMVKRE